MVRLDSLDSVVLDFQDQVILLESRVKVGSVVLVCQDLAGLVFLGHLVLLVIAASLVLVDRTAAKAECQDPLVTQGRLDHLGILVYQVFLVELVLAETVVIAASLENQGDRKSVV